MNQNLNYNQNLKQSFKLNQKMLNSLDFLKLNNDELNKLLDEALQSNPFIEIYNYKESQDLNLLENISQNNSLQDDLYLQLHTSNLDYDEDVVDYIIESLNERGFLSYSYTTYITSLNISQETFLKNLHVIQSLEPAGVAASDIIDSICLQLKKKQQFKEYELMKKYHDIILSQNYHMIEEKVKISKHEIDSLFNTIKTCNPFPCSNYTGVKNEYIIPDIDITIENDHVIVTPFKQSNVMINNDLYQKVREHKEMKKYFQEASFIIENLTKRNKTILVISNELVKLQQSYFLYDDELTPCTLSDLARLCGFHESTVSRTLNNKYYRFNNEIYPLKNLLVSKTTSGDSSDAIKKAIVLLISSENKEKPLSDEAIVTKLADLELSCSRRAIAKYRQQLNIPASSKRKKRG